MVLITSACITKERLEFKGFLKQSNSGLLTTFLPLQPGLGSHCRRALAPAPAPELSSTHSLAPAPAPELSSTYPLAPAPAPQLRLRLSNSLINK